ncbi:MAG: ankyrin repeat domain-containing protein, partial [Elusimicrobiaceae bacterium]|nr:ankyrin repeat domain-containing protein [Elusimicrobiaceae bacterium]
LDGNKEAAEKALKEYPDYLNMAYAANGNTPLHVAVWNGHKDIVELLLAQPAIDTQLKNKDGKTALDLAQEKNLTEIVNLLQNR